MVAGEPGRSHAKTINGSKSIAALIRVVLFFTFEVEMPNIL
jgi:hypothetical protein